VRRYPAIAALVLLAASCGSPSTNVVYSKSASEACLVKKSVVVRSVANTGDFVAESATGGAYRAVLAANDVTVSFGATLEDAANIDQAYRRFHAKNVGIDDVLRTQGSAIMLWHVHPSDADIATITGCLKK
jgi:hypothetical protein